MSVEHPTCPHCGEPLYKIVEKGVEKHGPCTKPDCPGKHAEPDDVLAAE